MLNRKLLMLRQNYLVSKLSLLSLASSTHLFLMLTACTLLTLLLFRHLPVAVFSE